MSRSRSAAIAVTALALALVSAPAVAQQRPTLGPDDYGRWESVGQTTLSPDGRWLAVSIGRVNDEDELRVHRTDVDSVVVIPFGGRPEFSDDGAWLVYAIGSSEDERDRGREQDRPVHDDLGLLNLRTGRQETVRDIASFSFSYDGAYLAMRRYKPEDKESEGVDVVVRTMATGAVMSFGNVSDLAWQDEGSLLALTIAADGGIGNGVSVFDPASGRLRSLDDDQATYAELSWRDASADLAVLKTFEDATGQYEDTAYVALAWRGLDGASPTAFRLDPRTDTYFPQAMRMVTYRAPSWSDDGSTVFVGIQQRRPDPDWTGGTAADEDEVAADEGGGAQGARGEEAPDAAAEDEDHDDDDAPAVEIWHALDVDPVPQQRVRETQLRRENFLAAWLPAERRFVQLADDLTERASVVDGGEHVIGRDETPYERHAMFRQEFHDLYAIDPSTGAKTRVEDRVTIDLGSSPGGRYLLWFEDDDYFTYDLRSGRKRNITEGVATTFVNLDVTPTREQMPPFGVGGWLSDDDAVLLYDEWDVWEVRPDGSRARRLTSGAADEVRYRVTDLDLDEEAYDPDEPIYYTTYAQWTKKAGYARARLGDEPRALVWKDKSYGGFFGRLQKAEHADVYAYREEAFDDSPDWFVGSADLADARQVTHTNTFQSEYAWGHAELVDYENEWGRRLQGALFYPADYEPGREYPMIVYQYEELSQTLHQYQVPDPTNYYNGQIWSHEGYFVLRPDIVYRDRRPGQSNVETLRPAVAAAVATGMIDEERIGLIGHSWGGYQTAFFVTQDDLFAAAVAGAPLTNLMSMYLSFYWNSGSTDARIFEISQGRMQVPWWEDPESYEANSPLHNIQNMHTPLLMEFGTNDGAVEYNQGVEFYNAARRLGKNMVMLSYGGENHGLAREPNQLDYHRRILQWFGHYLKGEPAPDWIAQGVPYIEQQDGLKRTRPIG